MQKHESVHLITSGEPLDIFARNKGKEWKGQTMVTFLARLVNKETQLDVSIKAFGSLKNFP